MKRVVLIGLGMVADTHLAAINDAPSVTLAGVMGRDAAKTQQFAEKAAKAIGQPVKIYATITEVAEDPAVDFIILATPPDARMDIVSALADAGKPILMEKPIERTAKAATAIVDICEDKGVPLGIVLQHRARAASTALKSRLEDGALGDLVSVELRVPWWRAQSYYDEPGRGTYARDGGGVMISQAIHTIDLALWLLGPFQSVQALLCQTPLHQLEAEDWAGALFQTTSGAVGTLLASTAAYPGDAESITLHGTQGRAHLCGGVLALSFMDGTTQTIGSNAATGGGADPMAFTHDWHRSIIEDFAGTLETGAAPIASGRSALMAHMLITALESANTSGCRTEVQNT